MMEEELVIWLRGKDDEFPRELDLDRKQVNSFREVINEVRANELDRYLSVFSLRQITRREFDTIILDVDAHGDRIERAYDTMRLVVSRFRDYDIEPRVYFTGRGFHIYIDFEQTRIENYKNVARMFVRQVVGSDVYERLDPSVTGDMRRMARIPLTVNGKVMLYCKRIEPDWSLGDILEYAKDDSTVDIGWQIHNGDIIEWLMELDLGFGYESSEYRQIDPEEHKLLRQYFEKERGLDELPPCIREGIERLMATGELDHYWRMHIATFLLRVWGKEDVHRIFKFAKDYSRYKTEYQLKYFIRRGIRSFMCRRAIEMGFCPYKSVKEARKKCPFYPSVNHWVPTYSEKYGGGDSDSGSS